MALVACKECKTQMSDQATACPKCGAPRMKSDTGTARAWGISIATFAAIAFLFGTIRSCNEDRTREDNARRVQAHNAALGAAGEAKCKERLPSIESNYAQLFDAKKFADARQALADCPYVLKDDRLKTMAQAAERLGFLTTIQDAKADVDDRLRAISGLRGIAPAEADAVESLRVKLQAQTDKAHALAQKKAEAAELVRRRKEGVTLGMTQEDVLKSSWGRPRRVNRTTYSFGTHEQWVYDGGYLYFEDGVLKTIQN